MKISVKFSCPEILGDMKSGLYEAPDGSTVRELLLKCEEECGFEVEENHLKWMLVFVNGRQVGWDATVPDDSTVSFLRGAMGG